MAVLRANKKNLQALTPGLAGNWATILKDVEQRSNPDDVDEALKALDTEIGGHGVEAINCARQVDRYYFDINLLYVNMGDPYINTIMYDTYEGKFYVGGWGDWVEAMERKHGEGWCP